MGVLVSQQVNVNRKHRCVCVVRGEPNCCSVRLQMQSEGSLVILASWYIVTVSELLNALAYHLQIKLQL